MLTLTSEQADFLRGIFTAVDELIGVWPQIEQNLIDQGFDDPEAAWEALRETAFNS